MSNNVNQQLIEEGMEWADTWEGTMHAELIRLHLSMGDLEALRDDILRARHDWYELNENIEENEYADTY